MTQRHTAPFLALFAGLALLPLSACAGLNPAQAVIQEIAARLQALARQDGIASDPQRLYHRIREILLPRVDHKRVSALVLGRAWRKASTAQRRAFAEQFEHLLVRTYAHALHEAGAWRLRFLPSRFDPGERRAWVRTQLLRDGGEPLRVDYRLARQGQDWRVYEVQIEGVSLITNYRSSFSRILRREGMNGLIHRLAERNATAEAGGRGARKSASLSLPGTSPPSG